MRYALSDTEFSIIQPNLPSNPMDAPRVEARGILYAVFWILGSGARQPTLFVFAATASSACAVCWQIADMTRTGSGPLLPNGTHGPTSHPNAIARPRSALTSLCGDRNPTSANELGYSP